MILPVELPGVPRDTSMAVERLVIEGLRRMSRQWRDVIGVLAVQGPAFDLGYAQSWAARLGLAEMLERALAEVGGGSG